MTDGRVVTEHEGWRYKHFSSVGADVSGNVTALAAGMIHVPFKHHIQKASFSARDTDIAGSANTAKLMRRVGTSGAAAQVAATLTIGDSSGNPLISTFDLDAVNEVGRECSDANGAVYYLELDTDNVSDAMLQPALSISVTPIPVGPA